jgi:hypothetical protein
MSLLTSLRPKKRQEAAPAEQGPCPHWELVPRWNSVADMGRHERVTYYVCTSCGERVNPEGRNRPDIRPREA